MEGERRAGYRGVIKRRPWAARPQASGTASELPRMSHGVPLVRIVSQPPPGTRNPVPLAGAAPARPSEQAGHACAFMPSRAASRNTIHGARGRLRDYQPAAREPADGPQSVPRGDVHGVAKHSVAKHGAAGHRGEARSSHPVTPSTLGRSDAAIYPISSYAKTCTMMRFGRS
jgi:hypothetical protein